MGATTSTHNSKHQETLSITNGSSLSTPVKVINSIDGKLQEFRQPVTAGNVLSGHQLDMFFVCNAEDMFVNCLVPHVPVDEELQMGQIYFIMPRSKSYRPISLQEICLLAIKASSALEKSSGLEMKKMGRTTSSGFEMMKMGRTTTFSSGLKKMGKTTTSGSEMKLGRATSYDSEMMKMGRTTSSGSEMKKIGRTTSYDSEMKKMGTTTSSGSEMMKVGRTTPSDSEMKKKGRTTSFSSELKKMARTTSSGGRRKRNGSVRRYEKVDFQVALKRL